MRVDAGDALCSIVWCRRNGLFCSFRGLLSLFSLSSPFVFNTFYLHCKKAPVCRRFTYRRQAGYEARGYTAMLLARECGVDATVSFALFAVS
jgi:hypothetical protein